MRHLFDTIARRAASQHGRVTSGQLLACGIDRQRIKRWVAEGRLRRLHNGVYAVGHTAPSLHGDYMAAVLACGDGALLSHHSAAHLVGILRARPSVPEVTVPTAAHRRRPGIVIHRVRRLPSLDATTWHGIPTTSIPRILLDLAPRLSPPDLTRACHESWVRFGTSPPGVEACIARNPHKPGAGKLRRALGTDVTLSKLEDGFLGLLEGRDLPLPRTNIDHKGDKVDCHWPDHGLTIELLSFRYHGTRHGFEADVARRRRSNHTAYTWGDIFERGARTATEVKQTIDARKPR